VRPRVAFACAYDPSPRYATQLRILLATLESFARIPHADIVVHLVDEGQDRAVRRALAARDIDFRTIPRFGDGRYCNKISQLDNPDLRAYDYVALCDLDLAFAAPIGRWIGAGDIAAKPVDLPNPPLERLTALYAAAGFSARPDVVACTNSPDPTYANNCNGGLYLIRAAMLPELGTAWKRWAHWVLDRPAAVAGFEMHADQLAFGLAAFALGARVTPLPLHANMPTHLPLDTYPLELQAPAVLHHHGRLATDATLEPLGIAVVDERIAAVNRLLRQTPQPHWPD
jgi:hypothetical protein